MSIVLHIERLVLDEALLGGERNGSVRDALKRELTQRLAQPGAVDALRRLGAVAALPPTTLPLATHPQQTLGSRIATAVQQGLGVAAHAYTAGKEH
ncbi:hypothetical protein [Rhodanobacter sp. T12-5]|uniref:hypothetical protein n=1 Tax=Rhodanobacter sp. T12-5 TaxID=2024611 RepID=UPI0011EC7468|nr:hypothetical protein [Rhodanobacter sp. T12-5]KAA0068668.1 hypothetical protein CIW53_15460 [Rhodanobacter sp. T12-5]